MHPINDIGIYSFRLMGLSLLGTKVVKDDL